MRQNIWTLSSLAALVALGATLGSTASASDSFAEAVQEGKPIVDVRLRYETVDQTGFVNNADGVTLRTRLGYETASFKGLSFLLEFENTTSLGDDDFNSTTNGNTAFPVIADPDNTEVNRLQATYKSGDTKLIVGRQRIILDGARFVGNVGFRQNEQTFDAVQLVNSSIEGLKASYTYVWQVNRIFGRDHPMGEFTGDTHLINVAWDSFPFGKLTGYGYLIDTSEAPGLSTQTYGLRYDGSAKIDDNTKVTYHAEYATQSDYADNTASFDLSYYNIGAGFHHSGFSGKVAYEVLEGNNARGFVTPLATLHKFQGFADVFLATPASGIEDLAVVTSYTHKPESFVKAVKFALWYHNFEGETNGMDLGSEFDALINVKINDHVSAEVKFADYDGASFAADRQKIWVALGFKY